jgi:hypothetical protein
MDNFEREDAYWQRFGIVHINRATQTHTQALGAPVRDCVERELRSVN